MKPVDILEEASDVVERCLGLVEIKFEVQDYLTRNSSKRICRCPNCRNSMANARAWLRDMRGHIIDDAA
jgi:hypothetical protein